MSDILLFSEWLMEQLRKRNWSQAELASAAGISRGVINKIINQVNKYPDPKTCVAIAFGLKMSPITVFVAAKLLPPMPERSSDLDDLNTIYADLSQEKRIELLVIARALLDAERS